jgi:hypothetical protein
MTNLDFNDETVMAGVVFALIKLVGYWFLARWIGRRYRTEVAAASPFVVALSRVVLGALVSWIVATAFQVDNSLPWYSVLVLLRAIEWAAIVWLFYEQLAVELDWRRLALFAFFGTLLSCVLDLPAAFGAVVMPMMVYGIC